MDYDFCVSHSYLGFKLVNRHIGYNRLVFHHFDYAVPVENRMQAGFRRPGVIGGPLARPRFPLAPMGSRAICREREPSPAPRVSETRARQCILSFFVLTVTMFFLLIQWHLLSI